MASRIPENHYPLEKDERVQWFSSPHEDTVLVKTAFPYMFIREMYTWHITLKPIVWERGWCWFKIEQKLPLKWVLWRWQLDRMLIAICNGDPAREAI